jgi:hypothetical protein
VTGPWSDWQPFTPLVATVEGVYGPAPGSTVDLKRQVNMPVAVPVVWLQALPTSQPYLKFLQTHPDGGYSVWWVTPTMPAPGSTFDTTRDGKFQIFRFVAAPGRLGTIQPGNVSFQFGLAGSGCVDDFLQCKPLDPTKAINTSHVQT